MEWTFRDDESREERLAEPGICFEMVWRQGRRRAGEREKGDERILGSGAFVSEIINHAEEKIKHQVVTSTDVDKLMTKEIARCCKREEVTVPLLQSGSRRSPLPKLRKILAQKLVNGYGVSLAEIARQLGVSTSGISQILCRG